MDPAADAEEARRLDDEKLRARQRLEPHRERSTPARLVGPEMPGLLDQMQLGLLPGRLVDRRTARSSNERTMTRVWPTETTPKL